MVMCTLKDCRLHVMRVKSFQITMVYSATPSDMCGVPKHLFSLLKGTSTYLGAAPIVECLEKYQPDVIITSRVADAALFLAPMVRTCYLSSKLIFDSQYGCRVGPDNRSDACQLSFITIYYHRFIYDQFWLEFDSRGLLFS